MRASKFLLTLMLLCPAFFGIVYSQTTISPKKTENIPPVKKTNVPEIPPADSRITFEYMDFDFGEVPPGAKVTHYFPVSNTGRDTLIISSIKAG